MTQQLHAVAWARNKSLLSAAMRRCDVVGAAELTQEREGLKRFRWCACGVPLSNQGRQDPKTLKKPMRCRTCQIPISRQKRGPRK